MIDGTLLQGWSGIALAYAAVQAPMIAGLIRGRAQLHHYFLSPLVAAPLTAIAALGVAASSSLLAHWGFASHGWVQWAAGAGLGAALGYAGGVGLGENPEDGKSHRRGTFIADARSGADSRSRSIARNAGITLAGTTVPAQDEAKHFKLIGTTGTGKRTAIREIMTAALSRGDCSVIADPDAGYVQRFYRPDRGDVVLNPFDPRSVKWDLFSETRSDFDVEQLARSLIPDHEGEDRSWRGYARTFFTAVTRQAHEAGTKDVNELYRLLVGAGTSEVRGVVRGTPGQPCPDRNKPPLFRSDPSRASA